MSRTTKPLSQPEFSVLSIVRMIWKHRMLTLTVWAFLTLVGIAVVQRLPAVYTAEAVILVDQQKIPERYVSSSVNTEIQDRITAITTQILSSPRLKKIIDDYGLYKEERKTKVQEEIIELLQSNISVKVDQRSIVNKALTFRVAFQGPDPKVVAQVCNHLANLYLEENLKTRELQAEGTSDFIGTQVEDAKRKLDETETALSQFKLQHRGELPQQEGTLGSALGRYQSDLQNLRESQRHAEETKSLVENTYGLAQATLTALTNVDHTQPAAGPGPAPAPQLTPLAAQTKAAPRPLRPSESLEIQLRQLTSRYGDLHPDVKRMRLEVARLKDVEREEDATLKAAASSEPPMPPTTSASAPATPASPARVQGATAAQISEIGQARERVSSLKSQIDNFDSELTANRAEQKRIQSIIDDTQARMDRLPIREQELGAITRDYEIVKSNYKTLLDHQMSAEMATDMERRQKSERLTIIDPGRVPELPTSPNRLLYSVLASMLGLALAIVFPFGNEVRKGQVLGEWELPPEIPVLGRPPYIEASRSWFLNWGLAAGLASVLVVGAAAVYLSGKFGH